MAVYNKPVVVKNTSNSTKGSVSPSCRCSGSSTHIHTAF